LTGGETRGSTFYFTLPSARPKELEQP
jgi:hypothetical protein